MALAFYMDHNVPKSITVRLRLLGVDVRHSFTETSELLSLRPTEYSS